MSISLILVWSLSLSVCDVRRSKACSAGLGSLVLIVEQIPSGSSCPSDVRVHVRVRVHDAGAAGR